MLPIKARLYGVSSDVADRITIDPGPGSGVPCPRDIVEERLARYRWRVLRELPTEPRELYPGEPAEVPPAPSVADCRSRAGKRIGAAGMVRKLLAEAARPMSVAEIAGLLGISAKSVSHALKPKNRSGRLVGRVTGLGGNYGLYGPLDGFCQKVS